MLECELNRLDSFINWKKKQVNILSPGDLYIKMSTIDLVDCIIIQLIFNVIFPNLLFLMSKGT